jgi:hypothetical protein
MVDAQRTEAELANQTARHAQTRCTRVNQGVVNLDPTHLFGADYSLLDRI